MIGVESNLVLAHTKVALFQSLHLLLESRLFGFSCVFCILVYQFKTFSIKSFIFKLSIQICYSKLTITENFILHMEQISFFIVLWLENKTLKRWSNTYNTLHLDYVAIERRIVQLVIDDCDVYTHKIHPLYSKTKFFFANAICHWLHGKILGKK